MDGAILGIEQSFPFIKHCYSVKLLESPSSCCSRPCVVLSLLEVAMNLCQVCFLIGRKHTQVILNQNFFTRGQKREMYKGSVCRGRPGMSLTLSLLQLAN